jgi:hypothetical protein
MRQVPDERGRQQALGIRFPLRPRLKEEEVPTMVEDGIGWACHVHLPTLAYRFLRVDSADGDGTLKANGLLVQMVGELLGRQARLRRIATEGIAAAAEGTPLFGGCYIAATGPDAEREQGFVQPILRQLIEGQNAVAWTAGALAEEEEYGRLARRATVGIVVAAVALVLLVYLAWYR